MSHETIIKADDILFGIEIEQARFDELADHVHPGLLNLENDEIILPVSGSKWILITAKDLDEFGSIQ